jgi:universal stress protein A
MKIRLILVPTDFSPSAAKALEYAIDFARLHRAQLLLVHVIEPMSYAVPRYLPEPTALLEYERKEAARLLAESLAKVHRRYSKCQSEIHFGVVHEIVNQLAKERDADLLIIGTHGRTGLAHMLMGSVAEKVIRTSTRPVLSVRTLSVPAHKAAAHGRRPRKDARSRRA